MKMNPDSVKLLNLLRGGTEPVAPYLEPWFMMCEHLKKYYAGSYLDMAEDLGHAAVPLTGLNTDVVFLKPVEGKHDSGVWYGGGNLDRSEMLKSRPEPDWEAQLEAMMPYREECRRRGRACWAIVTWCFHAVATSMGLGDFAMATYDDPEFVREAMEWVESRNRMAIKKVIARLKPDFVLFDGDCAYKSGTMIKPGLMEEFCLEPSLRTVSVLKDLDIPYMLHTDGRLDDVIPLLRKMGVKTVHGCEKQANDLGHLVDAYGDDMTLCGNADVVFLKNATPDEVREMTKEMLSIGGRKSRFIAGCNTSPMDYIPWENYVTLCRTVRDYSSTIR